jgi:hypothetical protein
MSTTPHVHTWVFDRDQDHRYSQLTTVYARSCADQGVPCTVHTMPVPELQGRPHWASSNHYKLKEWTDWLWQQPDGQLVLISDSDMFCVRAPERELLDPVGCVGLTRRSEKLPFNAGMIVVRTGAQARDFFDRWRGLDTRFFLNPAEHSPWRRKYAGINQASLGALLESSPEQAAKVHWLRCEDLNLCLPWANWSRARFVHVKSGLRKAVFGGPPPPGTVGFLERWQATAVTAGITNVQGPVPRTEYRAPKTGRYGIKSGGFR